MSRLGHAPQRASYRRFPLPMPSVPAVLRYGRASGWPLGQARRRGVAGDGASRGRGVGPTRRQRRKRGTGRHTGVLPLRHTAAVINKVGHALARIAHFPARREGAALGVDELRSRRDRAGIVQPPVMCPLPRQLSPRWLTPAPAFDRLTCALSSQKRRDAYPVRGSSHCDRRWLWSTK